MANSSDCRMEKHRHDDHEDEAPYFIFLPDFAWAILNVGLGWDKINPDIGTAFNIVPVEPREDVSDWERVIKMSHLIWIIKYES